MTAIAQAARASQEMHLRPLNPRRDLSRIADLIELCFAENLSADGRQYLRHMRRVAHGFSNRWFDSAPLSFLSSEGFVWEDENKRIVGNISLIPFIRRGRPIYLIANVAVHPNYRRRGIAQALTLAALNQARKRLAGAVWLQVRANNPGAIHLYKKNGFMEQARRTTWLRNPGDPKIQPTTNGVRMTTRKARHWKQQQEWLHKNYPNEIFWYWPVSRSAFRPGILGAFNRFFSETRMHHWSAERKNRWLGTLTWRAARTYADQLWLAAPPETEDIVLQTLLPRIHWRGRKRHPLSLDLPAGRAVNALQEAGFKEEHTLIWMSLKF